MHAPKTEIDRQTNDASAEPWFSTFPAIVEHKGVCALEQLYAELAP